MVALRISSPRLRHLRILRIMVLLLLRITSIIFSQPHYDMSTARRTLALLLLGNASPVRGRRTTQEGFHQLEVFRKAFFDRVYNSVGCGAGRRWKRRIVIVDVGSNNGDWSRSMIRDVSAVPCVNTWRRNAVRFVMVEPQRRFHEQLRAVAAECDKVGSHGLLLPFAAWTSNTTLNLTTLQGHRSQAAQTTDDRQATVACVRNADHDRCKAAQVVETPAIDLAAFLLRTLEETDVAYLKLDVEGSEYRLLPRLVAAGALCRLSFLHVEWHLHTLPEQKRLAGVALKHSLRALSEACASPPLILDEEFRPLNWGSSVPGLLEEAARHLGNGTTRGGLGRFQVNYSIAVRKLWGGGLKASRVTLINGK